MPLSEAKKGDSAVTPVTRLSWRDLTEPSGLVEEEPRDSPNDRIMWNNKEDPLYVSALSPMMHRRSRKRARSSSPISSPSADRFNPPAVNVKKLAKALKSPHADPTLELWDRYSLKGSEASTTPLGLINPALANLVVSSSPRPQRFTSEHTSGGGLRRAMSCGLNWPKKRRIERTKPGSQGSTGQRELEAASKSSLVSALLDTVTSSIHEQHEQPEQSPDETETMDRGMESPSPTKRRWTETKASPAKTTTATKPSPALSDYGDDDLDDSFLELEATMQPFQSTAEPLLPVREEPEPQITTTKTTTKSDSGMIRDDGFDDLDDDIFDDAEDLMATMEPGVSTGPPATTATPSKSRNLVKKETIEISDDLDDEFGDDFGEDIDLEAVELAATQSVQQQQHNNDGGASQPVCGRNAPG